MFRPLNRNQAIFLQFNFSNIGLIVLTFFIYELNFFEKILREMVFPFLAGKLMSISNGLLAAILKPFRPIFEFFFAAFWVLFCFVLFCFFLEYFSSDPNFKSIPLDVFAARP